MKPADVAVVTVTLVRDPDEERRLRRALPILAGGGMPVCVSDGGSGEAFTTFLSGLSNVQVIASNVPGLVGQVRAAMERAVTSGSAYVLYTESDKEDFFNGGLASFLEQAPPVLEPVSLLLAARSDSSFQTFPPVERHTERTISELCGESFGAPGDYSYGPFLMHRSLGPWIGRVPADLGWGWRHFMFAVAHRLGHRIVHVEGDHPCPEDQRAEDDRERIHRLKQLDQNVSGLQAGLAVPLA